MSTSDPLTPVLDAIRSRADALDVSSAWPAEDLDDLARAGVMRGAIPKEFGGDDLSALNIHLRYERIAAASLSVALVLSQRDSACSLIDAAESSPLRGEVLPQLAKNEWFTTVGIAQLTTSRQRGAPALIATATGGGYRLRGEIPWSTGAAQSEYIITGAVTNGQQILFALPRDLPGVRVAPPLPLVALGCTHTSSVICEDVQLDNRFILIGPTEQVLSNRRRNLSIGQSFLAMGLCRGGLDLIDQIDSSSARQTKADMNSQLLRLREEVIAFSRSTTPDATLAAKLRGQCNDLAVRITHAAVALHKGAALLAGHPAQRLARESMFLLVWSCPNPVIDCTLELLAATQRDA
ncbi:MAG: acyl-CoA/acyl-ACP dehydrogenase [Anaerolineae bacterium]|nr:acyl-CoA/acyl-ACP dehydrogenase [Phycisphaerae bacterium]